MNAQSLWTKIEYYWEITEYYWDLYFDIWIALIFAGIAAIIAEIVKHPFRNLFRKLYHKFFSNKLQKLVKRIMNRGEQVLQAAVRDSVDSKFEAQVPKKYIIDAITKHNALITNQRFHYSNLSKQYHLQRKFKLLPILNGDEAFFREMCDALSSKIDFESIDLILYAKKETNRLFAKEFARNPPGRIKNHSLIYKEGGQIEYQEGESLEGENIILLESLLIFPETILETIKWLQGQRANVRGVIILFNGSGTLTDFSSCGINQTNVIISSSIDLKLSLANECNCSNKTKLKILKYNEY